MTLLMFKLITIINKMKIIIASKIFMNVSNFEDDPKESFELNSVVNPLTSFGILKKIRQITIKQSGNHIFIIFFLFLKIYSSISNISLKILVTLSPESIDSRGSFRKR